MVKKYYEVLYEKLGRLIDNMTGEHYVTNSCKLSKLKKLNENDGEES